MPISIAINFYLQIISLNLLSFFLLRKEAQKKKGPKKKDAEKEISLVATSDKGYAPLTCAASPAGACLWVQCEHSALNYNLSMRLRAFNERPYDVSILCVQKMMLFRHHFRIATAMFALIIIRERRRHTSPSGEDPARTG